MKQGHLQTKLIEIGLKKGFLAPIDFSIFYKRNASDELNKWIYLGWLEKIKDGKYILTKEAKSIYEEKTKDG